MKSVEDFAARNPLSQKFFEVEAEVEDEEPLLMGNYQKGGSDDDDGDERDRGEDLVGFITNTRLRNDSVNHAAIAERQEREEEEDFLRTLETESSMRTPFLRRSQTSLLPNDESQWAEDVAEGRWGTATSHTHRQSKSKKKKSDVVTEDPNPSDGSSEEDAVLHRERAQRELSRSYDKKDVYLDEESRLYLHQTKKINVVPSDLQGSAAPSNAKDAEAITFSSLLPTLSPPKRRRSGLSHSGSFSEVHHQKIQKRYSDFSALRSSNSLRGSLALHDSLSSHPIAEESLSSIGEDAFSQPPNSLGKHPTPRRDDSPEHKRRRLTHSTSGNSNSSFFSLIAEDRFKEKHLS
jgi:hypothetical protein